jgi:hypothetical protein
MHNVKARLVVLALASLYWNVTLAQDGPVSAKEIQDTWVGKELIGTTASGSKTFLRLESDGNASVSAGSTNDTGRWRISENGYCTTWKTIRAGQERCYTVTRMGSTFRVANPDGTVGGFFNYIK